MTQQEQVILVDQNDIAIGTCEKLEAHLESKLHRAFSIFLIRERQGKRDVLLQQRHPEKYHSGNLWANTCCSHPRPDESVISAGERRLQEELGITAPLTEIGSFIYKAQLTDTLCEYEFDHVLIGSFEGDLIPFNKSEAIAVKWMDIDTLKTDLNTHPEHYVVWLKEALNHLLDNL
ncbi:MAG: isopentenyl-diphosphate Delta-isomerase [Coxiella sp. (in: Bacteria)]|nr:MAG: isopentenyl-diphosphate Delta-isomerase [Coxiella sp. (in: g-proteobacteria)]